MCKVFSTKAAQAFKACTLYAYKITKKELYYTYFEVFFCFHFTNYALFVFCLHNRTSIVSASLFTNIQGFAQDSGSVRVLFPVSGKL